MSRKFLLSSLLLLLAGCSLDVLLGEIDVAPVTGNVVSFVRDEGNLEVHFCPQENCSQLFMDFVGDGDVDCAFYELNKPELIEFLNRSNARIVVDADSEEDVVGLNNVVIDTGGGLMHNKFCISGDKVFTGSMNPTVNDITKNNNNMVLIKSADIAAMYETEFEELWNKSRNKESVQNSFLIDDVLVSIYFCPEDECADKVVKELEKAMREIYFMTFSFTHTGITNAVLLRHEQNVTVRGVFETRQISEYEPYETFLFQGIDVRKDGNKNTMHHKVFVIDNSTVITGSFNPTKNANERNDENLLIIKNEKIAHLFLEEFGKVWEEARVKVNETDSND